LQFVAFLCSIIYMYMYIYTKGMYMYTKGMYMYMYTKGMYMYIVLLFCCALEC